MDDQEFMVWLYDHYEERMRRTAKKYCRDEFLWEEILQESFLRLLSRIPKLRTLKEGERAGYLAVTVRNTAFTLLRKQAKERGWCVSLETGALPVEGCLPEEWVIQRERWNTLAAVWPQLAPTERFLLEGRYFQQRSDRELSDDLGCGANSIRMMMTRARRHVQRLMRREGEDQAAEQQK
ncbi:MAG: sigma-70 family RNA polymerase sigma factor [Evtepia gabavorous]|nr:sigma-70 family RNA polymerase sigma factor [Evtepia gabavorous]